MVTVLLAPLLALLLLMEKPLLLLEQPLLLHQSLVLGMLLTVQLRLPVPELQDLPLELLMGCLRCGDAFRVRYRGVHKLSQRIFRAA